MIIAIFGDIIDAQQACEISLSDQEQIHMHAVTTTNFLERNKRSIRVWDIPLNMKKQDIATTFTKFGEINPNFQIKTEGMWQSATIEYKNTNEYEQISQKWATTMRGDMIRIFPFNDTRQIRTQR